MQQGSEVSSHTDNKLSWAHTSQLNIPSLYLQQQSGLGKSPTLEWMHAHKLQYGIDQGMQTISAEMIKKVTRTWRE